MKKHFLPFALATILILWCLIFSTVAHSQAWIPVGENALPDNYFTWAMSAVDENTVYAISYSEQFGDPKLVHTADGGVNWEVSDLSWSGDFPTSIYAIDSETVWLVTFDDPSGLKSIYLTVDGGENWELKHSYQGNPVIGPALAVTESGAYLIDPSVIQASYSTDGGEAWSSVEMFPNFESGETWGMASPTNWMEAHGDTIWWGTSKNVHRSTDQGVTWESIDNAFGGTFEITSISFSESGTGIAISHVDGNFLDETHIQQSIDGGVTWTLLPVVDRPIHCVSDIPSLDNAFVGVGGIFETYVPGLSIDYGSAYTLDGGQTWEFFDSLSLNAVEFVSSKAGWAGRNSVFDYSGNPALFKWDGTDLADFVSSTDERRTLPANISPNPFSNRIQINFPQVEQGELQLMDVSGKIIRRAPFHGQMVELGNLDALSSGVYVLELKGDDFIAQKKVVKQ